MLADIVKRKKEIINIVKESGIPLSNLHSLYLYGSHLWGYDTEKSDIDLYVIVKSEVEPVKCRLDVSLHYQKTPDQIRERISKGSWASYFCLNYASYKLYGKDVETGEFKKETMKNFIEKHRQKEIKEMLERSRSWCYHVFIKRLFFLNYFFHNIKTFKLTDYQRSKFLNTKEKNFLEEQYVKIFNHDEDQGEDKKKLKDLSLNMEEFILDKINE